jgi:hypothetical protein
MKITIKVESDDMTIGVQSLSLEHINFNNLTKEDLPFINFDITKCKDQIMKKLAEGAR